MNHGLTVSKLHYLNTDQPQFSKLTFRRLLASLAIVLASCMHATRKGTLLSCFCLIKGCIHNIECSCAEIFSINFTCIFKGNENWIYTPLETSSEVYEAYKNTNQERNCLRPVQQARNCESKR